MSRPPWPRPGQDIAERMERAGFGPTHRPDRDSILTRLRRAAEAPSPDAAHA